MNNATEQTNPFTREELEIIISDLSNIIARNASNLNPLRREIIDKSKQCLSTPSQFPCEMEVSEGGIIWKNEVVIGMFNGLYIVESEKVGTLYTYRHARPIPPKQKTLADVAKGDKVYYHGVSGANFTFGYKYVADEVNSSGFGILNDVGFPCFIPFADTEFQLTPPTPQQIATARQAAIDEVNKRFDSLEKKVGILTRQLDDRVETYSEIVKGNCSCGESVNKVLNSNCTTRINGDRFYYPNETSAWGIFRCKKCNEPIDKTFIPKNNQQ